MLKELLSNTTWSLLGSGFSRIATLVAHILTIRWLGSETYGIVSLVQTISLTVAAGIGIGLGTTATKIISEGIASLDPTTGERLRRLNRWSAYLVLIGLVLVFCLREELARWIGVNGNVLTKSLIPGSLLLVTTASSFYLSGVLSGLRDFSSIAKCNFIAALATVLATFVGLNFGAFGIVFSLAFGQAIASALLYRATLKAYTNHPILFLSKQKDAKALRASESSWALLLIAIPLVLLHALNAPVDLYIFSLLAERSEGVAEIGVFNGAGLCCQILRFLTVSLSAALLPQLIRSINSKRDQKQSYLAMNGLLIATAMTLPFILLVFWFDTAILNLLGPSMIGQEKLLRMMVLIGALIAIQHMAERILIAHASIWIPLAFNASRLVLFGYLAQSYVELNASSLALAKLLTCLLHTLATTIFAIVLISRTKPQTEQNNYTSKLSTAA